MRQRPTIALALFTLAVVAFFTACGGRHRYDARLVTADSLMWDTPDSALAVLTAIDSLSSEANQAYRDLLVTQARYKCYLEITASDDSAISRAITHYRRHSDEREKLTRAYLYKGAVMEELGHIDSAMLYYKTAEVSAEEKDYTNLGQINTRIADLYRLYYADRQICFDKFKQALKYYQLTDNKPLQFDCLLNMGACSATTHIGNTKQLLLHAIDLAIELNDSAGYYTCQELLCRQLYYSDNSLTKAKQIALTCLNNYRQYVNQDLLLDLADIYALSSMPDSARYYLNLVKINANVPNIGQIKTRQYLILSRIYKLDGDNVKSSHYESLAHQVSDSILNNKKKYQIQDTENTINFKQAKQTQKNKRIIHSLRLLIIVLLAIAIILTVLFWHYHHRRVKQIQAVINELRLAGVDRHEDLLEQIDSQDGTVSKFIENLVSLMQTLIDSSQHDSPSVIRKRVNEEISKLTATEEFWNALRAHIDQNNNQLITNLAQKPRITENDLQFIELCCCGFNYIEIAIIMGYTPQYISQKRRKIASKLNLRVPLQEYLNQEMKLH